MIDFTQSAMLRTWLEVDVAAMRANCASMREMLPEGTKIMAVVKADAYCHGALRVAKALSNNVDCFAVASLDEAVELQDGGVEQDILVMGYIPPSVIERALDERIITAVYSLETAYALSRAAEKAGKTARVHLAVDTGMSRLGFLSDSKGCEQAKTAMKMPGLNVEGVFSHLASADEEDLSFAQKQQARFSDFVKQMEMQGLTSHLHNSAGALSLEAQFPMVRTGLLLYGLHSGEVIPDSAKFKQASALRTRIASVKSIPPGTSVGYGQSWISNRTTMVATLAAGYADGVPRGMSNVGWVIINGRRVPIVGRICMDMCMVDVTDIPSVKEGDIATFFGRDNGMTIYVSDMAKMAGTIPHELLCGIPSRVTRVYLGE